MHIGIVAGEASGDILGAGLIEALRQRYPQARFSGVGGPRMLALGFDSVCDMDRLAVMGLVEPLKRLPELLRIRSDLKNHFLHQRPAVVIGIDSPDFNLGLELHLRNNGLKTVHYVSPSVWAWRQGRVKKIARAVDLMLTLFPFEARFYERASVPVKFVGHPLADQFPMQPVEKDVARLNLKLPGQGKLIAVLPGSRRSEVDLLWPLFLDVIQRLNQAQPELEFVVPAANSARKDQIERKLEGTRLPVHVSDGDSRTCMEASDLVLLASGTSSLEAMFLKKPMVVAYKLGSVTYHLVKKLVKTKYIALPNLLADELIVKEFIQDDARPDRIYEEVSRLLADAHAVQQMQFRFERLHKDLRLNASEEAARHITDLVAQPHSATQ